MTCVEILFSPHKDEMPEDKMPEDKMPKDAMEPGRIAGSNSKYPHSSLDNGITEKVLPDQSQVIRFRYGEKTISLDWNPQHALCLNGEHKNNDAQNGGTNKVPSSNGNGAPVSYDPDSDDNPDDRSNESNNTPNSNPDDRPDSAPDNVSDREPGNGEKSSGSIDKPVIFNRIREVIRFLSKNKKFLPYSGILLMLGALSGILLYRFLLDRPNYKTIYVNPDTGINSAQGSRSAPVQTITQALKKAQAGDQILLQTGDYAATNQVFPFVVPPNVTMVVEPNTTFFPAFRDIKGHRAQTVIQNLAIERVVTGFPDGTFQPDALISRAQYAAMLVQAFHPTPKLEPKTFPDIMPDFWAKTLIQQSYRSQFLVGFPEETGQLIPGNTFRPNRDIRRVEVIVSLVNGLGLTAVDGELARSYRDRSDIPDWAKQQVKTAVTQRLVKSPTYSGLALNRKATRAEVATMINQALLIQKKTR